MPLKSKNKTMGFIQEVLIELYTLNKIKNISERNNQSQWLVNQSQWAVPI